MPKRTDFITDVKLFQVGYTWQISVLNAAGGQSWTRLDTRNWPPGSRHAAPVFRWSQPVGVLETSDKVAAVVDSNRSHDLLDAQERGLEELLRSFHTGVLKVFGWRNSGFGFKEMAQARNGQIHAGGNPAKVCFLLQVILH
jgi:hypothetical protein